ncbi:2234_t:CDS:2 [Entrophospora sp. SA101]|nr:2234_t:CDS:2 [Entrophospora sp. SA101]
MRPQKTDLLVLRLIDAMEILYVEVSGSPYKHDKKHTIRDVKKLLVMAVCNLCRILSNNFDCSIDDAKQVRTYIIRNKFIEQEKIQKKICSFIPSDDNTEDLREWINLPDVNLTPVTEDKIDEIFYVIFNKNIIIYMLVK